VIGPIWAGAALDMNLNFPFMTGATIMLIGFVTSLFYLKKATNPVESPASAN